VERPRHESRSWWLVVLAVAALAFVVRLLLMVRGGGLLGVGGYDDGVYYAAADSLVHGRLPYHDFLLIQPPAIVLAIAPFAWLGTITSDATGMVVGRLAFMAIGALNAGLVTATLRRFGLKAAAIGGVFYAVFFPAAYPERSTLLEPIGTLGLLVAVLIVSRDRLRERPRWLFVAGLALSAAVTMKIWYVVPLLVVIAFHRRGWRWLLGGAAAGVAAICLPFFVPAPSAMFREVVIDQLGRPRAATGPLARMQTVLGDLRLPAGHLLGLSNNGLTVILILVTVGLLTLAWATREARLFVALFVVNSVVLLVAPSWFLHYAAFTAPPLALVVGVAGARIAAVPAPAWGRAVVVAVALVGFAAVNLHNDESKVGRTVPTRTLQLAAGRINGCIQTDDPTILPVMDVLSRDLDRHCRLWPDVTGWTYDADKVKVNGNELPRPDNQVWQRHVLSYLRSGTAVITFRPATGLSRQSRDVLRRGRVLVRAGTWTIRSTRSLRP
jgi:hypothetical protein